MATLWSELKPRIGMLWGLAASGMVVAYGLLRLFTRLNVVLNLYLVLFGVLMGVSEFQEVLERTPLDPRVRFGCWVFVSSLCVNDGALVGYMAGALTFTRALTLWPSPPRPETETPDDETEPLAHTEGRQMTGTVGGLLCESSFL